MNIKYEIKTPYGALVIERTERDEKLTPEQLKKFVQQCNALARLHTGEKQ